MPNEYKQIRQSPPDKEGNFFRVYQNDKVIVIKLCLAKENREREIGLVNIADKTLQIKRNRAKHLFNKNESYGFNEHIIKTGTTFDNVLLNDEIESWLIPKQYIEENGRYLFFKEQGFEKQLFVSLKEIDKFKTGKLF